MKILITGGAGFIGSNCCNHMFNNGHDIAVVDNLVLGSSLRNIKVIVPFYKLDICELSWMDLLTNENPDIIMNFAAESHVDRSIFDPINFIKSNYFGVYHILNGIRNYNNTFKKNVFFIQISTDEVYGDMPVDCDFSLDEYWPLKTNNPYAASKAAADLLIQAYYHTYKDFDYVIVRASNNYGINQHVEKFIPKVIHNIIKNEKIPIYGSGENVRQWLYVDDFIFGINSIIDKYKVNSKKIINEVFNFGSKNYINNIDLVKKILKLMNKSEQLISFVPDRPGHDRKYSINYKKSQDILDWKPLTNLDDGLLEVIKDVSSRFDRAIPHM